MLEHKTTKGVLIVEDHTIVRAALVSELQKFSEFFHVVGEARDAVSAFEMVKAQKPALIFLDHILNGSTGLEFLAELVKTDVQPEIVVFTQSQNPHILKSYWQSNVLALIDKSAPLDDLHSALQTVKAGQRYLSSSFRQLIFSTQKLLSKRELEVVSMVARGLSNKEVAEALQCSDQTIKTHKSNIMRKLGVDSSVELGVWASENGIF